MNRAGAHSTANESLDEDKDNTGPPGHPRIADRDRLREQLCDQMEPFDDYWQVGPSLIVGHYHGHGSEVSLLYSLLPLHYETREAMASDGTLVPGSSLRFLPHHLELTWQQDFDAERVWRTTLRLSLERSTDNATGYYDLRAKPPRRLRT